MNDKPNVLSRLNINDYVTYLTYKAIKQEFTQKGAALPHDSQIF